MASKWFGFSLLLMCFWACAPNPGGQSQGSDDPLSFTLREINRQEGACNGKFHHGCISLKISYPEAVEGSARFQQRLDAFIQDYLIQALDGLSPPQKGGQSVEKAIDHLFEDYRRHREEFPDASFPWEVEIDGRIAFQSDRYLTLEMNHYEYTGGAHPNGWVDYAVFDRTSGQRPSLAQIAPNLEALKLAAEATFRAQQGLSPNESLVEAGYHFEGGEFYLPDNFGLLAEGLIFHYNPYEIAPHAAGPISILVPMEAVQPAVSQ